MDYIHLNPVRARMVGVDKGMGLLAYRWSSLAQGYSLGPGAKRGKWMTVADWLSLFDLKDTGADRRSFVSRMEQRARAEDSKKMWPSAGGTVRGSAEHTAPRMVLGKRGFHGMARRAGQ